MQDQTSFYHDNQHGFVRSKGNVILTKIILGIRIQAAIQISTNTIAVMVAILVDTCVQNMVATQTLTLTVHLLVPAASQQQ